MSMFMHEQVYRSANVMTRLKEASIVVCGAGALGANIVENLGRMGYGNLRVIDHDRIEAHNLSTQPYFRGDIGGFKARVLANGLYRAIGVKVQAEAVRLTAQNVGRLFTGADLVIDGFDNSASRQVVTDYCLGQGLACVHAGLSRDYAEVIWNEDYRVPGDGPGDLCDYPLARNLVMLTVNIACEVVTRYVAEDRREGYTITLGDLGVRSFVG